jgi:ubiquitin C-terminal hydrolase
MTFLKNNSNKIIYDYKTKQYLIDGMLYSSFEEAKSKQWQCDKCSIAFGSMKQLRIHKIDSHSY